jgi:hypothetical protein
MSRVAASTPGTGNAQAQSASNAMFRSNHQAGMTTCVSCGSSRFGSRRVCSQWQAEHACPPKPSTSRRETIEGFHANQRGGTFDAPYYETEGRR